MRYLARSIITGSIIALIASSAYCADKNKEASITPPPRGTSASPIDAKKSEPRFLSKYGVLVVSGTLSKIDTSDPKKVLIEIADISDGSKNILEVAPQATVSKVTDLSELKAGDTVRVMARKVDGKDVAMNIVFGKIRVFPRPTPITPPTIRPKIEKKAVKQPVKTVKK